MATLAFDTCFGAISAAVRWRSERGEWLLREDYEPLTVGHAERILPLIEGVVKGAGLDYADIGRIAVTIGPGGFTGLRAGIAAARALALAIGKPVVGISSLAIMAERANLLLAARRGGRPLVVAVDARREAFYVQIFGENAGDPLSEPQLATAAEAVALCPPGPILFVGSGAQSLLGASGRTDAEAALPDLQPHARHLIHLAPMLPLQDPLKPLYLRAADAKPPAPSTLLRGGRSSS